MRMIGFRRGVFSLKSPPQKYLVDVFIFNILILNINSVFEPFTPWRKKLR
ncbi:hypothetical protein BN1221_03649 [Brenneria goodwinii]|uniref:Uncharacterized protein n=1 Tax=Brenneria goodwinii TaxID=1109412 RepID=A0A0G4JZ81_9GAMM|nr:hypothetical protein BN1221_03649 [Brenneria goodwinii]